MTVNRLHRSPFVAMHLVVLMVLPPVLNLIPRTAHADPSGASPTGIGNTPVETLADGSRASLGVPQAGGGQAEAVSAASVDGLTGTLSAKIPFTTPTARGAVQPQLSLAYNSNGGTSEGGRGWTVTIPSIERHNVSGAPTFNDPAVGNRIAPDTQDRFTYGGAPLVPICMVGDECPVAKSKAAGYSETFPAFTTANRGWHYYRLEHEDGSRLRFFWSWKHDLWVVETADGATIELGVPMDDPNDDGALDRDVRTRRVYRWNVSRMYDAQRSHGAIVNPIYFRWAKHPLEKSGIALGYLVDVYDTPKIGSTAPFATSAFAHHAHLVYDADNNVPTDTVVWRAGHPHALSRVDVTSAVFADVHRELTRRYWLSYESQGQVSRLTSVVTEGTCAPNPSPTEGGDERLPTVPSPTCPAWPAKLRMTYSSALPSLAPTVHTMGSPLVANYNVPELVDLNSDGLPDFIAPPQGSSNKQTVAFNSIGTRLGEWTSSSIALVPGGTLGPAGPLPSVMAPGFLPYNSGNFAGNGRVNVLWSPIVTSNTQNYEVYSPSIDATGLWSWRSVQAGSYPLAHGAPEHPQLDKSDDSDMPDPYIECPAAILPVDPAAGDTVYRHDDKEWGLQTKYSDIDVDGDGYTDLITSRPVIAWACKLRAFKTQRELGGLLVTYGRPVCWEKDPDTVPANVNPYYVCQEDLKQTRRFFVQRTTVASDGTVRPFSAPESQFRVAGDSLLEAVVGTGTETNTQFADVNGDGLPDRVVLTKDHPKVWLGHGDGNFGICNDKTLSCDGGALQEWPSIPNAPAGFDMSKGRVHDVNADGRADLVLLDETHGTVTVYLNGGGAFGTDTESPVTIAFAAGAGWDITHGLSNAHVFFADLDGSGTEDIIIENAGTGMAYVDLYDGARPHVLSDLDNGLGVTTHATYSSIAALAIKARFNSQAWTRSSPQPTHVVTDLFTRDGAGTSFHTTHQYSDPVYDPRDHAFLGFENVTTSDEGDASSPTSFVTTKYFLGHCDDDAPTPTPCRGTVDYALSAYRGLPILTEVGSVTTIKTAPVVTYLSTTHHTFTGVALYPGMDGRKVRRVYPSQEDTWLYDTSPFALASIPTTVPDVGGDGIVSTATQFPVRSAANQHLISQVHLDPALAYVDARVELGQVDASGTSLSGTIRTDLVEHVAPGSDWTWRLQFETVTGTDRNGQALGLPRRTMAIHDALGNVTDTWAHLDGTLKLERFHAVPGKAFADEPPTASGDNVDVHQSHITYDPNSGQPRSVETPNGRCALFDYDPLFGQLLVAQRTMFQGCDPTSTDAIISQVIEWDRGQALPKRRLSPNGAVTTVTYDGFGRTLTIAKPNPDDGGPSAESTRIEYDDRPGGPVQFVHASSFDGKAWKDAYTYFDGFGRAILNVTPANALAVTPGADDEEDRHPWIVSGQVQRNSKGMVVASYEPWFLDSGPMLASTSAPATPSVRAQFDAFGRVVATFARDGTQTSKTDYHGLSTTYLDAEQLPGGEHAGALSSVTRDGHGRVVRQRSIGKDALGNLVAPTTAISYLPTGEIQRITNSGSVRAMQYDSLGRLVQNIEPNTSTNFDVTGQSPTLKAWRYAYNDNGDLVGTRDARGCGKNQYFDAAARIVAEDFSPCADGQPDYTRPKVDASGRPTGDGTEAFYVYDTEGGGLRDGHLHERFDRASHTIWSRDKRGRLHAEDRMLARPTTTPGSVSPSLADRYASHPFHADVTFDEADRVSGQSTGADVDGLLGAGGLSWLYPRYSGRGTLKSIDSTYGSLVSKLTYDINGSVEKEQFADAAHTISRFTYDNTFRRLKSVSIRRDATAPLSLADNTLWRDKVGNPRTITDDRVASEWPPGAQPVWSRTALYDDFYRLTNVETTYATGDDRWDNPLASVKGAVSTGRFDNRVRHQEFRYDQRGNLTFSDDRSHAFFDRALGLVTLDPTAPDRATHAELAGPTGGKLDASYDAAGNLTLLQETQSGPCTDADGACAHRFEYSWDEVGRLLHATRRDFGPKTKGIVVGTLTVYDPWTHPSFAMFPGYPAYAADITYSYDATGARVLRASRRDGATTTSAEIFPSLRLNDATWNADQNDYDRTLSEAVYLVAAGMSIGRVLSAASDPLTSTSGRQHVLFELTDALGSTSIVIDKETGELVERATYLPYGGIDTDYRPAKWAQFREAYGFTGKESDTAIGLTYFGARYYSPALGRFVSPDPLTVHAASSDPNPYAYVFGRPLSAVDPMGLECVDDLNHGCNKDITYGVSPNLLKSAGDWIVQASDTVANWFKGGGQHVQKGGSSATPSGRVPYDRNGGQIFPTPPPNVVVTPGFDMITRVQIDTNRVDTRPQNVKNEEMVIGIIGTATPLIGEATAANILAKGGVEALAMADSEAVLKAASRFGGRAAEACPAGCGLCFAAGTKVLMADGSTKPIEDIRAGDQVLSDDPGDAEPAQLQEVQETYRTATHRLFHIEVVGSGGVELVATGRHPFWTQRGWVAAEELEATDLLMDAAGTAIGIHSIAVESRAAPTFNLNVTNFHTYFVVAGDVSILVHNQHPLTFRVVDPSGSTRVVGNVVSAPMTAAEKLLGYPRNRMATHTEARLLRTVPILPGETVNMEGVAPPCNNCKGAMNALTESVPGTTANYTWLSEEGEAVTWSSTGGSGGIVCP